MSQFSSSKRNVEPPKSKIGAIVFLIGTLAAILVLFPPWESREERRDRIVSKVMKKVQEVEPNIPRLYERKKAFGSTRLLIKVVTDELVTFDTMIGPLFADIEATLNDLDTGNPSGSLARISKQAGIEPVKVDQNVFDLLNRLLKLSEDTGGVFDFTLLPYYELWGFDRDQMRIADPQVLETRVERVGWKKLKLDAEKQTAFLQQKGMGLDLRVVHSAVVLSKVRSALEKIKIVDYFVFFGSDALVSGRRQDAEWKMELPHPRKALHRYALLKPPTGCVMIANDYEKGFVHGAVRYHMYLDPKTGIPVQKTSSLAVIGPDPLQAKVLAYALFVLGEKEGLALIEKQAGYEVVMMNDRFEIGQSRGMGKFIEAGVQRSF